MGRKKRAISDVDGELKERAKEVGIIINVDKTKSLVQMRRLGKGGTLTVEDHKIEVVRRFKYRVQQKNLMVFKSRYIGSLVGWGNAAKVSG